MLFRLHQSKQVSVLASLTSLMKIFYEDPSQPIQMAVANKLKLLPAGL